MTALARMVQQIVKRSLVPRQQLQNPSVSKEGTAGPIISSLPIPKKSYKIEAIDSCVIVKKKLARMARKSTIEHIASQSDPNITRGLNSVIMNVFSTFKSKNLVIS